jgi:5-methylcytosine-specific restriction protein A
MNNPDRTRDELIVALDFYLKHRQPVPDKRGREVRDLSDALNRLGRSIFGAADRDATFRNSNGVYMKKMNFRALDPEFTGRGRRGLTRGAKSDGSVCGHGLRLTVAVVQLGLRHMYVRMSTGENGNGHGRGP